MKDTHTYTLTPLHPTHSHTHSPFAPTLTRIHTYIHPTPHTYTHALNPTHIHTHSLPIYPTLTHTHTPHIHTSHTPHIYTHTHPHLSYTYTDGPAESLASYPQDMSIVPASLNVFGGSRDTLMLLAEVSKGEQVYSITSSVLEAYVWVPV